LPNAVYNNFNLNNETSPIQWKKGQPIGEGTFSKVYRGLNEKTGELLAIKQLYLAEGTDSEVESLRKEINVMWNLDHENIVRFLYLFFVYLFIVQYF
jgi:serine/threonine protein kinase